jgi:hypothetical protein
MARSTGAKGTGGGGKVLAILLLAYIFNFIDRQIIGILAVPIKAELGSATPQLGLMGGIAFALFYTGIAIPDRLARRPQEPGQHHRLLGRLVERCSPPCAGWRRISGSCSWRGWASASARRAASRLPTR